MELRAADGQEISALPSARSTLAGQILKTETIYVKLLDEGTPVFRPTQGIFIRDDTYKLLPTEDHEVSEEKWEFDPGSFVICVIEKRGSRDVLVAKQLIEL